MSRITGFDAANLIEAYNAVYASQELTEEQVQEDFENWVNSLVEEGHDLSEYTWDDMYEEYLNELDLKFPPQKITLSPQQLQSLGRQATQSGLERTFKAGGGLAALTRPGGSFSSVFQQGSKNLRSQQTKNQPTPTRPAAAPARPAVRPAARPTAAAPTTTTSSRPVATSPAAPAAPRPTPTSTAPVSTTSAPPAPRPSLAQQTAELRRMRQASQQRQIAQGGTPATPLVQSFDPFDIVMGYLIDEGYAETEEAATVIMANMSDEWRQSIVDSSI